MNGDEEEACGGKSETGTFCWETERWGYFYTVILTLKQTQRAWCAFT